MKKLKFSIIIPVFNTEKYIEKCFNSILSQTYSDIEVILVDDGSTDNSLEICKKYELMDNRFKVVTIKNQGVSVARNTGLLYSTGDYITFLDSDDWLENNAIELIYEKLSYKKYDIIQCNLYINNLNNQNLYYKATSDLIVTNKKEILESIISIKYSIQKYSNRYLNCRCAGGKFYNSNLIKKNNIKFPNGIKAFEDGIFNLYAYSNANDILIIKDALYHYFKYDSSATGKYYIDQKEQNDGVLNKICEFIETSDYELQTIYNYCIFELYYVWVDKLVRLNNTLTKKQKINEIKNIYSLKLYNNAINSINKNDLTLIYRLTYLLTINKKFLFIYILFKIKETIKKCR